MVDTQMAGLVNKINVINKRRCITMCYNCGCEKPDDDMGKGHAGVDPKGKSITNKTFQEAAKSQEIDAKQAKKNTLTLLQKLAKEE